MKKGWGDFEAHAKNNSGGINPKKDSEIKKTDIKSFEEYFSKKIFIKVLISIKKKSIQNNAAIKNRSAKNPLINTANKKE